MKNKPMPTTLILLFFSWSFAFLGLTAGIYYIILHNNAILVKGWFYLFAGLFLSIIIRTLANISQIFFDSKAIFQKLTTIISFEHQGLKQNLNALAADAGGTKNAVQLLLKKIEYLSAISLEIRDIATWIKDISLESKDISQVTQDISGETKNIIITSFSSFMQDMNSLNQFISSELQEHKNVLEQMNCDSKDINQNINQIKLFFEQIEKHLDLKK